MSSNNPKQFFFVGHRGTRVDFDENTLPAFKKAIEYGANYIELDVRLTKDKRFVVFHDQKLDRMTAVSEYINNINSEKISTFQTKRKKSKIPFLIEVFNKLNGKIKFMIDLKEEGLGEEIIRIVEEQNLIDDCVISGRILSELANIKKQYESIKTCYNITKGKDLSLFQFFKKIEEKTLKFIPDMINLKSELITSEFIDLCHKNDILTLAWSFLDYPDAISRIQTLILKKIDGILFDNYKNIRIVINWFERKLD